MHRESFFGLACLALLAIVAFKMGLPMPALAQGPANKPSFLWCADLPQAQTPGKQFGSACQVGAMRLASQQGAGTEADAMSSDRRGETFQNASESDSDLIEDQIKVDGFLYIQSGGNWYYDTQCGDAKQWATHAACRNSYSWNGWKRQDGDHYFSKAGWQDTHLGTRYEWQ